MTWQPIETAPKDGKPILIFSTWPMRSVCMVRWIGPPHSIWSRVDGGTADRCTHWMPLPAPPEQQP